MRAPIALAAFTGMRRGELLGLRWLDVDLPNRRLYLHETKNGSLRVLVLKELAVQVLASLPEGATADTVLPGVDPQQLMPPSIHCAKRPQVGSLCRVLISTRSVNCSDTKRPA